MIIVKIEDSAFRNWFLDAVSNALIKNSEGKKNIAKKKEIKNTKSLFRLLYSSTSIVQRLEISRVQNLEIFRHCTLEISTRCTIEVEE